MGRTTGKASARKPMRLLETLWDDLLSRQPKRIRSAFSALDSAEQKAVFTHLQHMVSEDGWQPEQRLSAQAALSVLDDYFK